MVRLPLRGASLGLQGTSNVKRLCQKKENALNNGCFCRTVPEFQERIEGISEISQSSLKRGECVNEHICWCY